MKVGNSAGNLTRPLYIRLLSTRSIKALVQVSTSPVLGQNQNVQALAWAQRNWSASSTAITFLWEISLWLCIQHQKPLYQLYRVLSGSLAVGLQREPLNLSEDSQKLAYWQRFERTCITFIYRERIKHFVSWRLFYREKQFLRKRPLCLINQFTMRF